jgi:hypothetical protein
MVMIGNHEQRGCEAADFFQIVEYPLALRQRERADIVD